MHSSPNRSRSVSPTSRPHLRSHTSSSSSAAAHQLSRSSRKSLLGSPIRKDRERSISSTRFDPNANSNGSGARLTRVNGHLNVILELDLDCNIIWGSKSWLSVLGIDIQALIGKPISSIILENSDCFQHATDAMLENSSSYRVRFSTTRGDSATTSIELKSGTSTELSTPAVTTSPSAATSTSSSSPTVDRESNKAFSDDASRPLGEEVNKEKRALTTIDDSDTISSSHQCQKQRRESDTIEESTNESNTKIIEMEGQGIIIYDRHSMEACYSMWILRPFIEALYPVVDLPQSLVDSLGFGADVLARYISNIAQGPIIDLQKLPTLDPVMCRICERQIQPWWFERHSELCLVEHKSESEVQSCQDNLRDHRATLVAILQYMDSKLHHKTEDLIEYRGMQISAFSNDSKKLNNHNSHMHPRLNLSLSPLKHFSAKKSPMRVIELLIDLCDMAMEVSTPSLRDTNTLTEDREGGYQIRVHSPHSESCLRKVLSWNNPTVEDEALELLCRDTERVAKSKIEAVLRLGNTITYSEKIQRELNVVVQETIEEAVSQAIEEQQINLDDAQENLDEETPSDMEELKFFSGYGIQEKPSREDRESSPGLTGGYNSSTISVASGSSPLEDVTQRSFTSSLLSRPRSRKVVLKDEDSGGGDSDSSRSSLVYLREKADSPVSDSEMSQRVVRSRKSSSNFMYGSPHRQQSPSFTFAKSPLMTQKVKSSSVSDGSIPISQAPTLSHTDSSSAFTPMTSPLLFPLDSYQDSARHRRKSSAASDVSKAPPLSPLLTSVTPAVKPAQQSIKDFEIIKPISRGAFGSVYLTKKKTTGDYFAMKVLKKSDMIAKNQITNVKAERAIMMAQAESPFVAKLFFTFQSKEYLYLVMEYMNGGDMAALLKAFGAGLPEDWVKKYIAEVILGIENLHERGVVHRDLKPDNLLIDMNGHLKLTDFGLSRMGLLGRQTRARNSSVIDPPDIFNGHYGRSLSSSSQSYPDTPQFVDNSAMMASPNLTPHLSPEINLPSVPGYFSLSRIPTNESIPKHSGIPPSRHDALSSVFGSFSLSDTGSRSNSRHRDDDTQSVDSSGSCDTAGSFGAGTWNHTSLISASNGQMPHNIALVDLADEGKRFVGTPDYLAPEIINGSGEDEMSDWWSLGCILFEFLYGYPPFHAPTPELVFDNILNRRVAWPSPDESPEVSPEAIDLINKLVCMDSDERLGSGSSEQVKRHPFFKGVDWNAVCEEEAPFIPQPLNEEDTAYFDDRGAILQTFPEEETEETADRATGKHEEPMEKDNTQRNSDHGSSSSAGGSRHMKILPPHISHHLRGRRARRLSEPVGLDDFGSFAFKNLPVLEKANRDVIQRLKSEHLEHMKPPAIPSGLAEPSPVKPRNSSVSALGSAISLNYGKRASSPSSSSSSNSSLFRNASPNRGSTYVSIPSSPLTTAVPISANTEEHMEVASLDSSIDSSKNSSSPLHFRGDIESNTPKEDKIEI
ncbi:hypothetical protein V1511DRAFT_458845 [Dipodascopsis uninucleata]